MPASAEPALGAIPADPPRSERLWLRDEYRSFPVLRVNVSELRLNPQNRRFTAERGGIESQLGRALDPDPGSADEVIVIALLLDKDVELDIDGRVCSKRNPDTAALRADWIRRRQERPLWVRPDGLVTNGNRRLALLKRLIDDEGPEGFENVDAIVLDYEYKDPDLFEMEAREQLTEGLKVRYSDVNVILTLKEAAERANVDWGSADSIKLVAKRIEHLVNDSEAYVELQLTAAKYMTQYLLYVGRPGQYHTLRRRVERFRDVARNMLRVQEDDPSREAAMLELCFAAVRAGNAHGDLREIRKLLERPSEFDALVDQVRRELDRAETDAPPADAEAEEEADVDEDEADVPSRPEPGYAAVRDIIDNRVQDARRARESAVKNLELADLLLARIDPESLLAEAGPRKAEVRAAVARVLAWGEGATEAIGNRGTR